MERSMRKSSLKMGNENFKMKSFNLNAVITGIRAKVDGSLGLTMSTPELSSSDKAGIMELQNVNLTAFIKPCDETPTEIITIDKEIKNKSQSQRIRAVLFLLWKQEGEPYDFEIYYRNKTNLYIGFLKEKLE